MSHKRNVGVCYCTFYVFVKMETETRTFHLHGYYLYELKKAATWTFEGFQLSSTFDASPVSMVRTQVKTAKENTGYSLHINFTLTKDEHSFCVCVFQVCLALETLDGTYLSSSLSLTSSRCKHQIINLMRKHPNSSLNCAYGICKLFDINELGVEGSCFTKNFLVSFIEDVRISPWCQLNSYNGN